MIVAISAVSESSDHYLWCETGTAEEIIQKVSTLEDFAYLTNICVEPLQVSEYGSAEALRIKLQKAVDKAQDNL